MEPSRITSHTSPRPQQLRGVVVGAGQMARSIRVAVERLVWHRKIKKQFRRTKTFLVHDAREEARVGDSVVIEQSRPISKRKRFRMLRVTKRAVVPASEAPTDSRKDSGVQEEAP